MNASTSRSGAMAAVKSAKRCLSSPLVAVLKPTAAVRDQTRQPVLRFSSTQPQTQPKKIGKGKESDRYNYNTSMSFSEEIDPDHVNYRRVTAGDIASRREPPTKVKMLVRDFIDDSLYNPHYGYFPKNATIFTPPSKGFDFGSFRDATAFQEAVAERYDTEYEDDRPGLGRQVWHTPTELFKPHYARTLTSAIVQSYKHNHFPHRPLTIYEIGAGNGSFMADSVAYIKERHPEIYKNMKYKIVEISAALAKAQRARADKEGLGDVVEVINEDFFKWSGVQDSGEGSYVVALEVFDNLAHDMIRYDVKTLTPYQAVISIDPNGDFAMLYEPLTDPLLRRYLAYQRLLTPTPSTLPPLPTSSFLRSLYSALPFAPNLSKPDWIPTKAMLFMEKLRETIPGHRLMVADFSELPDTVEGRNGPVVQTRLSGRMIPCETILVKQGYFDIFFPTDFDLLKDIYSLIMNSPSSTSSSRPISPPSGSTSHPLGSTLSPRDGLGSFFTPSHSTGVKGFRRRKVSIYDHAEFLEKFGGDDHVDATRVKDGSSPMLSMYSNGRMMF